jgi:hypothetical protein
MTPSASAPQRIPDNDRVLGRRLDSVSYEPLQRPVPAGHAGVSYDTLHDAANYHASRSRNDMSATTRVVPGQTGASARDDMARAFKEQTARYDQGAQRNLLQGSVGRPRVVESGNQLPLDVSTTRSADAYLSTIAPVGPVPQHQQPIGHHEDPLRQLVSAYERGPTRHVELERRPPPPTVHVSRTELARAPVAAGAAPHHATAIRSTPISTPPTRRVRGAVVVRPSGDIRFVGTGHAETGALRATRIAMPSAAPKADAVASVGAVRPMGVRGSHAVGLSVTCADRSVAFTSDRHDVSVTSSRPFPAAGSARPTHHGSRQRHVVDAVPVSHTGARRVSVHVPVSGASQAAAPGAAAAAATATTATTTTPTVRRITDGRVATGATTSAYRVHAWRDGEATTQRAGAAFPPRCSDV